jgi:hypothetical protein
MISLLLTSKVNYYYMKKEVLLHQTSKVRASPPQKIEWIQA